MLTQQFLADLQAAWQTHGRAALHQVAVENPGLFLQIMAKLVQVHRVEVGHPGDFQSAMNRAELLDRVGERVGEQGREMFERFMAD